MLKTENANEAGQSRKEKDEIQKANNTSNPGKIIAKHRKRPGVEATYERQSRNQGNLITCRI